MIENRPNMRERMDNERARRLAEASDISPAHALLLVQRYGEDEAGLRHAARKLDSER